ncbi:glycosyltransferase [Thalassococcus profundi]|uniref:Glycosyltransferase n=1 Tax=Thalassococcus profundi TaxID=2282382 RepID=A0A369TMT4_9RHOB|nr:glycosyltransferase [Thalassococcus profundi]RDD66004.1 glycosyltransferase [Thalassococcus profundi]
MGRLRVVHLVDDTTAGGVMRVLDHILTSHALSRDADHELRVVDRYGVLADRVRADSIVSHLAISWRMMPLVATLRAFHPRTPLVHVEHSYTEGFVAANVTHTRRFGLLLRTAFRLFDRTVAVSHAQGRWLERSGAVPAEKLTVIQSCVDLSGFRALAPVDRPAKILGAIGRLDRQKGFDTLIKAFRQINRSDLALHIYGEGAEEAHLRHLAQDDPRIRFMGFASDPLNAMEAVDAVAMPSAWEAYGLVAIEAMAAGRPLLVNPVDGLVDHVTHGAILVSERSVDGWRREILKLAEGTPPVQSVCTRQNHAFEEVFAASWNEVFRVLCSECRGDLTTYC